MSDNLFTREEIIKLFSEIKTENVSYISDSLIKIAKDCCQLTVTKNDGKTYVSMEINSVFHSNVFEDKSHEDSLFNELSAFIIPEINKDNFKKIILETFK